MNDRDADAKEAIPRLLVAMFDKLAANRHKPHWRRQPPRELWGELCNEVIELLEEVVRDGTAEAVWAEAADVANLAMMVADAYTTQEKR